MSSLFDNHIAQIDADAELYALICRNFGIALAHAALDRHRASDRLDDARELDQQPVAGRLDDAALVLGDLGIGQLASQSPEARQGAGLVLAHQPAVPRDITRENRRQSALDPLFRHRASLVQLTLRRCPRPINRGSAGSPLAGIETCVI